MTRARWISAGAGVLAIAVGASLGPGLLQGDDRRWIDVQREPFVRRIPASGELRSANNAVIGCPQIRRMWNFTIAWLADEGIEVSEGQPVLTFDAQLLKERLQIYRSRLDTARSELERTRIEQQQKMETLELERVQVLAKEARLAQKLEVPESLQARAELEKLRLDQGLVQEELRLIGQRNEAQGRFRESSIAGAENKVSGLELDVEQLEQQIAALNVTAPRAGFVVQVEGWDGKKPKVGESVWAGQSLLQIADLSRMEVLAEAAERDALYVREGQRVEIRLDANPDRVFSGEIMRLGKLFHGKSPEVPTMVFDAIVSIEEPDPELMRPGMAAAVEIIAPTNRPVIQIPEAALFNTDEGPVVELERDGKRKRAAVVLGPRWQGRVVIEEGLEEGDRVAVRDDAA